MRSVVRRLTPLETERLMGFPDDYLKIDGDATPDGPRYKGCGNSWSVNSAAWVTGRIHRWDLAHGGNGIRTYATVCSGVEAQTLALKAEGIDARLIGDKTAASGTALILVDRKGQNCISVALGANGTLSPEDVAPFASDIERADALLLQLETPLATVLWAARTAHAKGVHVILNPAPAAKLPRELYACLDWITPNETEAELLTGVKVVDLASAQAAERVLKRRGVAHVAITLGAKGCYAAVRIHPCVKVKAVDTVAAGDTFNGAFVVALAEGKSVDEAVAFAQKASAIAVTRPGAQSSVPFRKEVGAKL